MRKDDLTVGELYAADGPGNAWNCAKLVRVKVLEVGVVGDGRRRGGARADGSRVVLDQDIEWVYLGETKTAKAGVEYVLRNKDIRHEWTEADDEREASIEASRKADVELRERLMALGVPPRVDGYMRRSRIIDGELVEAEDVEGFEITRKGVTVDRDAFLRWLERIDPVRIGTQAIEEYTIAAEGYTVIAASKKRALDAIVAGLAVTEQDVEGL